MGRPQYRAPTNVTTDDEPTPIPEGQTEFDLGSGEESPKQTNPSLNSRRGNPKDIATTQTESTFGDNRPDPKEIVSPQTADKVQEEPKYPSLTDADRLEYLAIAKAEGVPLSKIDPEKFGGDPAAFMIEQSFLRAKDAGWTNEEYKSAIDEELVNAGYDLKDFGDSEGSSYDRFQTGLANTLTEMYVGGKELIGQELSAVDKEQNKILFQQKKQKEAYHKYAEATMDDDGQMDSNFDLAGGFGELAPSLILGLGVGGVATRFGVGVGKALTADFAAQQALSTMEFKGASEADEGADVQYGFETAGNLASFGIGKMIGSIGKAAEVPAYKKEIGTMGQAKAADTLETIKFAQEQGVDILGHDIDPGTQYSQLMEAAASNPVLSGKLKDITEKDVGVITEYLSKVKNDYNEVMQSDANMGQYVTRVIDAQEEAFDTAIGKAYNDMDAMLANNPSALTNETFISYLDGVKANVNKLDMEPKVRKHLQSTIDDYVADFQATGKSVNAASMYRMMRDTIAESANLSKQVDKGAEARAYAQLAETFEKQFDSMSVVAGKGSPQLEEVMNQAKKLYKERVEKFGYRGTGKGGKGTGFISSFREKYLKDPEGAMKLVNTPEKVREIKAIAGDSGDTTGLLQRHFLDKQTTKSNGVPLSMEEAGRNLSKGNNEAMIAELYGADARQIDNLAKVMTILGKREKALTRGSSLVANEILNKGLVQAVPTAIKFLVGKYKGGKLVDADRHLIKGIEKEMQSKLGMSLEEYAASVKGSKVLPASVDVGRTADELYTSPEGVPTAQQGEATQADIASRQAEETQANKAQQAQQASTAELERVDKRLATQATNLNREVRARFATKQVSPDDRLEFNRIKETLVTAKNAGDRKAVKEATSELSAFTEHTKNLPDRETSAELATREAKEAKEAKILDKAEQAEQVLRRARTAMEARATEINRARLARAREAEEAAAREAQNVIDDNRAFAAERASRQQQVLTTREQANDTMATTLTERLEGNWSAVSDGPTDNHPRFRSDQGEYFTLHIYSDSMGATTVGLRNGSGAGKEVYPAIFDMAKELGVYYKPDSTLLTANPIRTGMNMINYMKNRGEDALQVMMSPSQRAIGSRGSDNYLGNKKLTMENANQLAKNMVAVANRKLPSGINLTARTTDEQLVKMAAITGGDSNMRLGLESLKLLRDFKRNGNDLQGM